MKHGKNVLNENGHGKMAQMMTFINKHVMTIFLIAVLSALLMMIEDAFRFYSKIQLINNHVETSILICFLVITIRYAKLAVTSWFAFFFLCFSYLSQLGHLAIYKSWLSAIEIYLFFEKFREVFESGSTLITQLTIPLGISFFVLIIGLYFYLKRNQHCHYLIDCVFLIFLFAPTTQAFFSDSGNSYSPHLRYSAIKSAFRSNAIFFGKTLPNSIWGIDKAKSYYANQPEIIPSFKMVKNIILVMGESQNIDNASVFGYKKSTTPFMQSISNSAIVKKTYAGGVYTDVSLPSFFNLIKMPDGTDQVYSWRTNIFRLAKQQGYNTSFYTAQAKDDMTLASMIGLQFIDDFRDPVELGYSTTENAYDDELVPWLKKINLLSGKHFIVLHQRGSHGPYADRTRQTEKPFGTSSLEDEYNNSVYKTDNILQGIHQYLVDTKSTDWLLMYTSDHGQYVKNGAFGHGSLNNPSHYTVPSVVIAGQDDNADIIRNSIGHCEYIFHHQLSTLLSIFMGYKNDASSCDDGYINGARLNGSSGVKFIH